MLEILVTGQIITDPKFVMQEAVESMLVLPLTFLVKLLISVGLAPNRAVKTVNYCDSESYSKLTNDYIVHQKRLIYSASLPATAFALVITTFLFHSRLLVIPTF